jgi:isoleucyl-tRNA synthetase
VFGNSPFKAVLTHGFIVDEQGRKMSKSIGNVVTLDDVIENWGADIFRMWVASSDFTQDLKLGTNILKQLEDVYRKLRNTLRYMLGALHGYDVDAKSIPYNELPDLEKWTLHRLHEADKELTKSIEDFNINRYFSLLLTFCSNDLSSFFFDVRKDCLYCDHDRNPKRLAYRHVLFILFQYLIRRLAPIIVFTAEEAWLSFHKTSSVHLKRFLPVADEWYNSEIGTKLDLVKDIRRSVTAAIEFARKAKLLGSSLQASVTVFDPDMLIPVNDDSFWEEVAIVSEFKIDHGNVPDDAFVADDLKNIGVRISLATGEKCERCWKVHKSLNTEKLCPRCCDVLAKKTC